MALSLKSKIVGGVAGVAVIAGLVVVGGLVVPAMVQASVASEPMVARVLAPLAAPTPGAALDDSRLLKFNGDYYAVDADPGVSLEPQSQVEIKKIAYGQTSFVTVMTTSSGTYSSDGLASSHVRYPGIHTSKLRVLPLPFAGEILGWSRLTGWTKIPLLSADSIGYLDTDTPPASDDGVCIKDTHDGGCR